jgi:signal transduction histidine kinase
LRAFVALRHELGEPVAIDLAEGMPAGVTVLCGPLAFSRMLGNLADNAIRYGGLARFSIRCSESAVEIAVEDEGPGIPRADLPRVIKPFERLEASRARATGGAGLGLAIVKALAESVGGTLIIENRVPTGLKATIVLVAA